MSLEITRTHGDKPAPGQYYIGDDDKKKAKPLPTGKFVKNISAKLKKETRAGVSQQVAIPDHQEKLTKHGKKKIVTAAEEDDKPVPHVQPTRDVEYATGTKRKNAPPPRKRSLLRKNTVETGPVQKKQRRVSAHQV
jgi:hypothetical protein